MEELKTYLDWSKLSTSNFLNITEDLLIRFKQYWNWHALPKGLRARNENDLWAAASRILNQDSRLVFLSNIDAQESEWKGYIYHYAHLENAASILNQGKIKSRSRAHFKDTAAQQIVYRRTDPHNFARFYFRPRTPYQYYTERLGRPFGNWRVEYPKCPVPIFFRIKLSEVMFDPKVQSHYYITNNNFHADSAINQGIDQAVHFFDYEGVYRIYSGQDSDKEKYKRQVQQEFVVDGDIDITGYDSFQIICQTDVDAASLIHKLDEPKEWIDHVIIHQKAYLNKNPQIHTYKSSEHFEAYVSNNGKTVVSGKIKLTIKEGPIRLIRSGGVLKESANSITVLPPLEVEFDNLSSSLELSWIDESERTWEIYNYKEL